MAAAGWAVPAAGRDGGTACVPQALAFVAPGPVELPWTGQHAGVRFEDAVVAAALAGMARSAACGAVPGGAVAGVPQALAVLAPGPVPLIGRVPPTQLRQGVAAAA